MDNGNDKQASPVPVVVVTGFGHLCRIVSAQIGRGRRPTQQGRAFIQSTAREIAKAAASEGYRYGQDWSGFFAKAAQQQEGDEDADQSSRGD